MKINILDDVLEIENTQGEVEKAIKKINEIIYDSKLNLSNIKINDIEVYGEYYENIINNLEFIETIDVILKSSKEIMDDVLYSTENYLERIFPELDKLIEELYGDVGAEVWNKFEVFFEGLQLIVTMLSSIKEGKEFYSNMEVYNSLEIKLVDIVKKLEEALKNNDITYLSDLITYEIKPILEELHGVIKRTIEEDIKK